MKDEIKEILDDLRTYKDRYEYFLFNNLSFSDRDYKAKILLDYITNLQEELDRCVKANVILDDENAELQGENQKLKELCDKYEEEHSTTFEYWKQLIKEDYKSRNEKAKSLTNRTIEIIKQQPSGNDEWILERLNGINYCLGGDEE